MKYPTIYFGRTAGVSDKNSQEFNSSRKVVNSMTLIRNRWKLMLSIGILTVFAGIAAFEMEFLWHLSGDDNSVLSFLGWVATVAGAVLALLAVMSRPQASASAGDEWWIVSLIGIVALFVIAMLGLTALLSISPVPGK